MGLSDLAERLTEYRSRLAAGKVEQIQAEDVEFVIDKLRARRRKLAGRLEAQSCDDERVVLERKLAKVEDLINQAEWLRDEL